MPVPMQLNAGRRSPAIMLTALAASLGFICATFGLFAVLLHAGQVPFRSVIDPFFASYRAVDSITGESSIADEQHAIHKKLGNVQSKTIRGIAIDRDREPASTVITYDAQFENGPATVTLVIQGGGPDAKLIHTDFRSPLLPRQGRGGH